MSTLRERTGCDGRKDVIECDRMEGRTYMKVEIVMKIIKKSCEIAVAHKGLKFGKVQPSIVLLQFL